MIRHVRDLMPDLPCSLPGRDYSFEQTGGCPSAAISHNSSRVWTIRRRLCWSGLPREHQSSLFDPENILVIGYEWESLKE